MSSDMIGCIEVPFHSKSKTDFSLHIYHDTKKCSNWPWPKKQRKLLSTVKNRICNILSHVRVLYINNLIYKDELQMVEFHDTTKYAVLETPSMYAVVFKNGYVIRLFVSHARWDAFSDHYSDDSSGEEDDW